MAAIIFFLYKKWGKRSEKITSDNSDSDPASGSGVRRYLSRRYTHKSDDRIMNDLMTAAYSAESGRRDSFQDQMPVNVNGYLTEKKRQMTEDDEIPIMMMSEPEPVAQPAFKRTKRISKWLRRHDSQMLNPDLARASLASNATGLRSLDLESMSGMGSDDGYSDYGRSTEPLSNLRPPPRQKKQEQPTYSEPLNTKGDVQEEQDEREEQDEQDEQEEIPNLQGLNVRIRDSTPVAQFPTPEELNLPPPPGRPTSIAARTENTGRSSGTWNTWGVTQHREEPKGWKAKLGM